MLDLPGATSRDLHLVHPRHGSAAADCRREAPAGSQQPRRAANRSRCRQTAPAVQEKPGKRLLSYFKLGGRKHRHSSFPQVALKSRIFRTVPIDSLDGLALEGSPAWLRSTLQSSMFPFAVEAGLYVSTAKLPERKSEFLP
ncbi:MAG: hypothetical protein ACLGSH_00330 [Acidobacteriota bacterium]